MNPHYPAVAARARHRCEYCHAPELAFNFRFDVEHVSPGSLGGADDESNLALACRSCNLAKSAYVEWHDKQTGKVVALFNPRRGSWNEHFDLDPATLLIHGLNPVGRATTDLLRMNSPAQVTARQLWSRLGLLD